jgi:hypothetical protein
VSTTPILAPDAAMALGIACTAMPFARTPEDEVERWLRVLRLHGRAGTALQELGVSEVRLDRAESLPERRAKEAVPEKPRDPVALVTERALQIAEDRGGEALATTDVLLAVMDVYGEDFDRVLHVHGAEREQLLERLGA